MLGSAGSWQLFDARDNRVGDPEKSNSRSRSMSVDISELVGKSCLSRRALIMCSDGFIVHNSLGYINVVHTLRLSSNSCSFHLKRR